MAYKTVVVTAITYKHGTDHLVNKTRAGATQALFEYVLEWWENVMENLPMPKSKTKAIEMYFEVTNENGTEFYEVNSIRMGS
jgi:hypothetical protein